MEDSNEIVQWLQDSIPAPVPSSATWEELKDWLSGYCNTLLKDNFPGLIQLLYRVDVSEQKLKYYLKASEGEDAGKIMAHLILERVEQIILARRKYRMPDRDIPEEDKW